MKKLLIVTTIVLVSISCTKDQDKPNNQEQTVPTGEFEALRQEVEALKAQVDALGAVGGAEAVSVAEFEKLKTENEELKATVATLTSTFFEVEGLRFDQNGSLISTPRYESKMEEIGVYGYTLTTERKYDAQNRIIEIYKRYGGRGSSFMDPPFNWEKTTFEYIGKTCRRTVQTKAPNQSVQIPYEEEVKETVYW